MKLAFIVALKGEVSIDKKLWKLRGVNWKLKSFNNNNYYSCRINNNKFFLFFSKVGKANAASATSILINCLKVDNIINVGSAGTLSNKLTGEDLCIVNNAYYSDADATGFKYAMNQIPQEPIIYTTSKKLNLLVYKIIGNKFNFRIHHDIELATSDSFVTNKNKNRLHIFATTDIVDMEGASILQIANHYKNINVTLIKFVSDGAKSKYNTKQWDYNVVDIRYDATKIIAEIIDNV